MRRTLTAIVTATTIVAATALPAVAAEPDGPTPSAITWEGPRRTDPVGDPVPGPGGADVEDYQMSFDDETGELVLEARVLDPADLWAALIFFDTDRNRATGCQGAERQVFVRVEAGVVTSQEAAAVTTCGVLATPTPITSEFLPAFNYLRVDISDDFLDSPVSFDWTMIVVSNASGGPAEFDYVPDGGELGLFHEEFGWVRPFTDVRTDAFYSGPIAWLRQAGLSTGIGSTGTYDPDGPVTRAQMATFIWRIAGEPFDPPAPFVDIQRPSFYATAVDWFYDAGLTTGVGGSDRFAPNDPVTRAQMVTFLWRYAGEPTGYPDPGFDDVTGPGTYYYEAVAWAKAEGITTGIGGTDEFRPDDIVSRGQLATFLHRFFAPLGTPTFIP